MNYSIKKLNYKQLLPLVSALAMIVPTSGNTAGNLYKSGAYTGASIGYSHMHTRVKDTIAIPIAPNLDSDERGKAKAHGLYFDVFGGYRQFFENHYLIGFELGIGRNNNSDNKKFENNNFLITTRVKSKYKFMPALVFGKQLNERWLMFAKVGVSLARFEGARIRGIDGGIDVKEHFKKRKAGFMGSLGAEYAHNEKLSTIGSITYERFGAIKCNYTATNTTVGEQNTGSFKPSYVTAKIGLAYRF
jgi:opacity protein-like surface antigen